MRHPKDETPAVEIDGKVYTLKEAAEVDEPELHTADKSGDYYNVRYLSGNGVVFYIYALVVAKKNPPLERFRQVKSIPREIAGDLDEEQSRVALDKAAAGHLWFMKLDGGKSGSGIGWHWNTQGGAKGVVAVQPVLDYLLRFQNKKSVGGVEALHIEINNRFV